MIRRQLTTAAALLLLSLVTDPVALVAAATRATKPLPPTTADVLARAREQLEAEDPEQALALLDSLLASSPDDVAGLLLRSEALIALGEVARGRSDLERALARDPSQRQGWLNLAALAVAERRYDDALVAMRRAKELAPAAPENELNIGAIELLAGRLPEASRSFATYLERNRASAEAAYLVATNYALAGYAGLAAQHLQQAITLDERSRVRARIDPNFGALIEAPQIVALLENDAYQPPAGAYQLRRELEGRFTGPPDGGQVVLAVLDALQQSGEPFDPRVEVTRGFALIWASMRIKISAAGDRAAVELSAPPTAMGPEEWERRSQALIQGAVAALAIRRARSEP